MLLSFLEPGVLRDNWGGLAYGFILAAGLFKLFLCFKTPVVVLCCADDIGVVFRAVRVSANESEDRHVRL